MADHRVPIPPGSDVTPTARRNQPSDPPQSTLEMTTGKGSRHNSTMGRRAARQELGVRMLWAVPLATTSHPGARRKRNASSPPGGSRGPIRPGVRRAVAG